MTTDAPASGFVPQPRQRPSTTRRSLLTVISVVLALLASTMGSAEAQVDQSRARAVRPVETLRLACAPDFVDGERGVLCRWSEATNPNTRAYQLYRIVDGSARELLTTVGNDGRRAFFDTDVSAPSSLIYGVISVNHNGRLIGRSQAVRVQYGEPIEQLRMACVADSINGERGALCRWSEPTVKVRGYLVYRSVDGAEREVIARIPADGRRGHFDTTVIPGSRHTYGVTAVDGSGAVVAVGGPQVVGWPAAD